MRDRGRILIFGGVHGSTYPEDLRQLGNTAAVVRGDGDQVRSAVLSECVRGTIQPLHVGGQSRLRILLRPVESGCLRDIYAGIRSDSTRMSKTLFYSIPGDP